jgi:hypothetical protein
MPIYQRGKTWWIDYTDCTDQRVRRTSGTQNKREAQELHDKIVAEVWEQKRLGIIIKPSHTWQEAVVRWLSEQSHKKSINEDKNHLRWLHQHLHDSKLEDLNKTVVDKIRFERIKCSQLAMVIL